MINSCVHSESTTPQSI